MQFTYTIRRLSETQLSVTTAIDDRPTDLFAMFDASEPNMSGSTGAWTGNYPDNADAIVEAAMSIGVGDEVSLTVGEQSANEIKRAYPLDAEKAARWDATYNEGGEGYNPYR